MAANLERQQANFERQDRLLAEIEAEIGAPAALRPSVSTGVHASHREASMLLSPLAKVTEVDSRGHASNQQEASTASYRQLSVWQQEVSTQRRIISELRDSIAELQHSKIMAEQQSGKVCVGLQLCVVLFINIQTNSYLQAISGAHSLNTCES